MWEIPGDRWIPRTKNHCVGNSTAIGEFPVQIWQWKPFVYRNHHWTILCYLWSFGHYHCFRTVVCNLFHVINRWSKITSYLLLWGTGFLHDLPLILPRRKLLSNESNIIYICERNLSDPIVSCYWIWSRQQIVNKTNNQRVTHQVEDRLFITFLSSFMDAMRHARNKIYYLMSSWTVYAFNWLLFWFWLV